MGHSTIFPNTSPTSTSFDIERNIQMNKTATRRRSKQQDDRLLKQLSRMERRQQEELRQRISKDPIFATV